MRNNLDELRKSYFNMKYSNDEIHQAKLYMADYKVSVKEYKQSLGVIGRFFGKLFGTSMYNDIEKYLYKKYNLTYGKAFTLLYATNNEKDIYNPFAR